MRRVRVLLLTQWFDPEPTFKGLVFARELQRQGFDVEVLTGFPNYPGGRLYPGYRLRLLQRECIDGVRVTRVPLYPSHDRSAIGRVLNYVSFAISASLWGLFNAGRFDVVYAYHPPLTVGIAAGLIRVLRRVPMVYDIQDLWPDTLRATGMIRNARALKLVGLVCDWVYRRMDQLVVLSPGFKQRMIQRGVPERKIEVIYNWADEVSLDQPQGQVSELFPQQPAFRLLFAGNMGKAQALDAILAAARVLQQRGSRASFVMLGGGLEVEGLKSKSKELGLGNIVFLPPVPMAEVGAYLQAADALLVHLRRDPLFEITIPSKTQAYMAVGKPVLMAVDGDAADLIRESGGGLVACSEDVEDLARAVEELCAMPPDRIEAMGRLAREHYQSKLSLRVGVGRFAQIFNRVAR